MNEIEQRLAEMFEQRERDVAGGVEPIRPILRRARRRQVGIVVIAFACIAAMVAVPILGVSLRQHSRESSRPASQVVMPDVPDGFQAGVVPYASIAYPKGWFLLDTSPLSPMGPTSQSAAPIDGPILQLTNVDPDVAHSPRCMVSDAWPADDAVMLTLGVAASSETAGLDTDSTWPVQPGPFPSGTVPECTQDHETASWTGENGLVYWANLGWGPSASHADIDALHQAFESLRFPASQTPWLDTMSAYRGQGTPRAVLGTTTDGNDVLTFVAYLELDETLWVGVESNGSWTTATAPHTGSSDSDVEAGATIVGPDETLLDGVISPKVSRVEVRTGSGDVEPMNVLPIPASLGVDDRYVWALVPGADQDATVVGYDASGQPFGDPTFHIEPNVEIAHGVEDGDPWTLEVTHDNRGWGLDFTDASGGGGGGGVDLGDRVFGSMMSTGRSWNIDTGWSNAPYSLSGVVTDRAASLRYELVGGETIDAQVFDVPQGAFGGGAKAFVLFVPVDTLVNAGDLVALDAHGNEIGRQYFDGSPVALYPRVLEQASPEALDAMHALQLAGGVAAQYFFAHDGWQGFDPAAASSISSQLTYNTSSTAVAGEVSLRVGGNKALVLATRTPSGDVYSACIEGQPTGGATEGRNDATDASQCSNGWLNAP